MPFEVAVRSGSSDVRYLTVEVGLSGSYGILLAKDTVRPGADKEQS